MKVLVLGGNGFIGSNIVDALLLKGHKVRVFGRSMEKYRDPIANVEYYSGSLDCIPIVSKALEGVDIVYHLISTSVPSTSNADPVADVQGNLIATINLLKLMVEKNIFRIVYISSGGTVYGDANCSLIAETQPLSPMCSYGIIKVAIESYLFMYQALYGVRPIVLRVSNPYGKRQGEPFVQGVIGSFLHKIKINEPIEIWGDGSIVRDFLYIDDLVSVCVKAGESEYCGVLNVAAGVGHSILDVFNMCNLITENNPKVIYKESREFDIKRVVLDVSKAEEKLGWRAETTLLEGITKTWLWVNQSTEAL